MVLGKKIAYEDEAITSGTFWLKGWLNMPQILKEIVPLVAPKKILSVSIKYVHGLTGEETEVRIFAVSVMELEVRNEQGGKENKTS